MAVPEVDSKRRGVYSPIELEQQSLADTLVSLVNRLTSIATEYGDICRNE